MLDKRNIDFICTLHGTPFIQRGDIYKCKIEGCNNSYKKDGTLYDFINKEIVNAWSTIFSAKEQTNMIKRLFDRLIYIFITPIFNSYIVKVIESNYRDDARLIELGCGEATVSRRLLKKRNYFIVVVDNNQLVIKRLEEFLKNEKLEDKNFFIIRGDFYNSKLCFPEHYFDISYNVGVIEHFDDPVKAVIEMKRLAKRVICLVPAPSFYWKISIAIRRIIEKDISLWVKNTKFYHIRQLKAIFDEAGLRQITTHQIRFLGLPLINCAIGDSV